MQTGALVVPLPLVVVMTGHLLVHQAVFVLVRTGLGGGRERRRNPEHAADNKSERD